MGMTVDGASIAGVYFGTTPVKEVWAGGHMVWKSTPPRPVVRITLGQTARKQLDAHLKSYGIVRTNRMVEVPFDIELAGRGAAEGLFENCSELRAAPAIHVSGILTSVKNMFFMCRDLQYVPPLDTRNVTDARSAFSFCRSLTDGNVAFLGKRPGVKIDQMIQFSGLGREPFYDYDDYMRRRALTPL